ncbi:glycoside hydrolase family 32 protein [Kribbella sp. VKM Ac-2568]|uniref:glycoside hydrolase family 32 protein n=1 Tax=Kribbella sp. VKM Ac-2568 TaxID=2512219 RepID=UPI001052E016|nr:glycoside hydrolase family 32 protein [Kribbella sp. VKM Ac-2568]TCM51391.1 levanase/fructan beta-fructosidase [Kribbella sp. VKM Ac-2568]
MSRHDRPTYHFTPRRNWLNDPNGLVKYDDEWHLFFQHNPNGTDWGNMSWGHAVSADLVDWDEQPVAISYLPDEHVFSGSIVVDHADTSGFGQPGNPAMVAIYTGADPSTGRQVQCVAWSLDRGRTFTRYHANPVIDAGRNDFRDPKVFWYDEAGGGYWVMVVVLADRRMVQFYRSDNLRHWTHLSDFGPAGAPDGIWECPDLFRVRIGPDGPLHWVMLVSLGLGARNGGSASQYFVGDFDGKTFTAQEPDRVRWLDYGPDHYAAVSFAGLPTGEVVTIGWAGNWAYSGATPSDGSRGQMSVPRRLTLARDADDLRLVQTPVVLPDVPVVTSLPHDGRSFIYEGALGGSAPSALRVLASDTHWTEIGFDAATSSVYVDRTRSGAVDFHDAFRGRYSAPVTASRDGSVAVRILVDAGSVEVFADGGRTTVSCLVFPHPDQTRTTFV